ncbi:MAG TPA: DUF167 domain-containing protein [Gemmatimonadales bacterium]|nr:DUF167 domain-containing protein [Gemmatimonadales bacterium]
MAGEGDLKRRTDGPAHGRSERGSPDRLIVVQVQPGARRTEVQGRHGDAIRIRVAAVPADGAANRELIRFLADRLNVPRTAVQITGGAGSRRKRLRIVGRESAWVMARLLPGPP